MERPGKVLWDNPGIAAAPHGILCNPSNTVASPVADKTSSFPNFSIPLERANDRKCEPLQRAACHGVGVLGELGMKAWRKLGRDGGGAERGEGRAPSSLMFQLLEGKD